MQRTLPYCLAGLAALLLAICPVVPAVSQTITTADPYDTAQFQYYTGQIRSADTYNSALQELQQQYMLEQEMQHQYMLAQNTTTVSSTLQNQLLNVVPTTQDRFLNEAKEAYEAAYGLVLDEDWKNAASSFTSYVEKYMDSPWRDDAQFWLCYSEEKGGMKKPAEAFECYQTFIDKFPTSNWADDAKTNMIRLARAIEQSGDTSYRAIVQDMQADEEEKLVLTAIMALQRAGDDETIMALIGIYDKSDNSAVRERIVYTLGNTQTRQAVDKLMDIARNDRSDDIRTLAVQALGRLALEPRSLSFTSSTNRISALESAVTLRNYQNEINPNIDIEEIARTLKDIAINDKSSSVRNAAFRILASAPADVALEFIIDTAKSGDDYNVRRMAVEALGRSTDPRAREALIDIINSQK